MSDLIGILPFIALHGVQNVNPNDRQLFAVNLYLRFKKTISYLYISNNPASMHTDVSG